MPVVNNKEASGCGRYKRRSPCGCPQFGALKRVWPLSVKVRNAHDMPWADGAPQSGPLKPSKNGSNGRPPGIFETPRYILSTRHCLCMETILFVAIDGMAQAFVLGSFSGRNRNAAIRLKPGLGRVGARNRTCIRAGDQQLLVPPGVYPMLPRIPCNQDLRAKPTSQGVSMHFAPSR
jgi:hypothetical protein